MLVCVRLSSLCLVLAAPAEWLPFPFPTQLKVMTWRRGELLQRTIGGVYR